LQARFLDGGFCLALLRALGWKPLLAPAVPQIAGHCEFEVKGWDVYLVAGPAGDTYREDFWIELKTSLGDDYPAVLRQMKANCTEPARRPGSTPRKVDGRKVLVFARFAAIGATLDQVKGIFRASRFRVLGLDEIEAARAALLERVTLSPPRLQRPTG
jgi:hypothetical protein